MHRARPRSQQPADYLYADSGNVIFKSINGGLSWSALSRSPKVSYFTALAIDPLTTSTVYAATDRGVFKSIDAGSSWKAAPSDRSFGRSVSTLAIHPSTPSVIYAGAPPGVFKSTDGLDTWESISFLRAKSIYALVIDPQKPSTVYAADSDYPDFDYVDTQTIVYASADDGATWNARSTELPGISAGALVIDPAQTSSLYAGTRLGLYKSVDAGSGWTLSSSQLQDVRVSAVAIDPRNPTTLYAGTLLQGILRSTDGGASWLPFNSGLTTSSVYALALDRTGTRLHAGTDHGVFDYQISSGPQDLSVGTDGATRLASVDLDDRVVLRTIDRSGNATSAGPYGPYSGWNATAVTGAADGLTRVLWNNEDGPAALWLVTPQGGNQASYRLNAMPGFMAVDVAASIAGITHVLWTNADGRITISTVDNSGRATAGTTYGPYPGWTAIAAADGPDGSTRVLWNNLDGRAAISFARAGNLLASYSYGPAAGWTGLDVAVGGDGLTRILWSHHDGRIALGIIDSSGQIKYGPVYPAPENMSTIRIATGPNGSSQVLFTDFGSSAILWEMSADGAFVKSIVASEAPPSGGISGAWTGTYNAISYKCGTDTRASLSQSGSAVTGTLTTTGSCGEIFYIDSTLQGNTLGSSQCVPNDLLHVGAKS